MLSRTSGYKVVPGAAMLSLALLFSAGACKDPNNGPEIPDFDRPAMLENIAAKVIMPAYESCDSAIDDLENKALAFKNTPAPGTLASAQASFLNAWKRWQYASPFEIGPAMSIVLRQNINTYPADTGQIMNNIRSGIYNLNSTDNLDAKGFPALDYLLYGKAPSETGPLDKFTGIYGSNALKYLSDVAADMQSKISSVNLAWKSTGSNYAQSFKEKAGTAVGSSTGDIVNELNFDLELIKNYKIGVPLGIKTLGIQQPEKVEALYSSISVQLAIENLKGIESLFLGSSGLGLDDYLNHVGAKSNGVPLSDRIAQQITITLAALQAIPDPLQQSVMSDKAAVEAAYNELKKLNVLMKTEMPSALGVLITYQDNDGD